MKFKVRKEHVEVEKVIEFYLEESSEGINLLAKDEKGSQYILSILSNDGTLSRTKYVGMEGIKINPDGTIYLKEGQK